MGAVLVAGALAGCSSGGGGITVDAAREAASGAGPSPAACPVPFDVGAALPGRAVRPGQVRVQVAKTTTPAADPVVAQRDQGMSALDAAAGASIDCEYGVDGRTLDAWLVVTPIKAAVVVMAPKIAQAGKLSVTQVQEFVNRRPGPGEVEVAPGGDVAVARIPIDGDGDAALLVDPDGTVTGDALGKTTETLASQVHF